MKNKNHSRIITPEERFLKGSAEHPPQVILFWITWNQMTVLQRERKYLTFNTIFKTTFSYISQHSSTTVYIDFYQHLHLAIHPLRRRRRRSRQSAHHRTHCCAHRRSIIRFFVPYTQLAGWWMWANASLTRLFVSLCCHKRSRFDARGWYEVFLLSYNYTFLLQHPGTRLFSKEPF